MHGLCARAAILELRQFRPARRGFGLCPRGVDFVAHAVRRLGAAPRADAAVIGGPRHPHAAGRAYRREGRLRPPGGGGNQRSRPPHAVLERSEVQVPLSAGAPVVGAVADGRGSHLKHGPHAAAAIGRNARQLPVAPQALGHRGAKIPGLFPRATLLDGRHNGTVGIEHRAAVLVVVAPVLAPVGAGFVPGEPYAVFAVDGERRVRLEPRRTR